MDRGHDACDRVSMSMPTAGPGTERTDGIPMAVSHGEGSKVHNVWDGPLAAPRPVWKRRVGYVLWAAVATLLATFAVIKYLLLDLICGEGGPGGVWVCRRMRSLTTIGVLVWAVALTYVGLWWKSGRIKRSRWRLLFRVLLVILPILGGLVLLAVTIDFSLGSSPGN